MVKKDIPRCLWKLVHAMWDKSFPESWISDCQHRPMAIALLSRHLNIVYNIASFTDSGVCIEGRALSLPPLVNVSFLSHHVFLTQNVPNNFALKGVARWKMTKECRNEEEKRIKIGRISFGVYWPSVALQPMEIPWLLLQIPWPRIQPAILFSEEIREVLK